MSLLAVAAVKLGETVVKSACEALTGQKIAGDIAGDLTAVLGGGVVDRLDSRQARRRLEAIADTVAERIRNQYEHEFRGLTEEDRALVVETVDETFSLVPPAAGLVMGVDFDAAKLERRVRELTRDQLVRRRFGQDESSLYDLLLRVSCGDVVNIVRTLSGLADIAVPEVLRRLADLAIDVRESPRRALADAAKDNDSAFADVYRQHVASQLDTIDLDSKRLSPASRRYPLSLAYLSLPALVNPDAHDSYVIRIERVFASRSRVLLQAHCGGGKTTCLYRLFMLAARQSLTGDLAELNTAVPFYLPLHRYAKGDLPAPEDFLHVVGRDIATEMPHGWVQRQLRHGESLVLINGLDEVPADRRPAVLEWITRFTRTFDRPRYVLTSRPGAVAREWPAAAGFDVVDLLPMGPGEARAFIRRWHDAIKSSLRPDVHPQADARADKLLDALTSCHALRVLSTNPLTCALMCALHWDGQVDLPVQWLELIRMVVEILVGERDEQREVADGLVLSVDQRIRTLQNVAYWMTTEDLSAPALDEVRERVGHLMGGMDVGTTGTAGALAEGVVAHMVVRGGLMHLRSDGTLSFTSDVLRDYLAAREAVSGSNIRSLLRDSHLVQRHHLVVMAAGHAPLARAEELLSGLLARAGEDVSSRDRFDVLVRACLQTVPGLGSELRQRVEASCRPLTPRTAQEAEALAAAGPLVVDLLAAQPTDDDAVALALVQAAACIGGNDVLPLLARLAGDPRPAVQQAVKHAASRFNPAEYDPTLLAGCLPAGELVRSTSRHLGGGGQVG